MRTVPLNITMSATSGTGTGTLPKSLNFSPDATGGITVAEGCVITFVPMGHLNKYIADPSYDVTFTWNKGTAITLLTTSSNPTYVFEQNASYELSVAYISGADDLDGSSNATTRTGEIIVR